MASVGTTLRWGSAPADYQRKREIMATSLTTETPAEVHITIPGATTEDVRSWGLRLAGGMPYPPGEFMPARPEPPKAGIIVTDQPFMGVELTLAAAGRPLLILTLFGDQPDDEERTIMETGDPQEMDE